MGRHWTALLHYDFRRAHPYVHGHTHTGMHGECDFMLEGLFYCVNRNGHHIQHPLQALKDVVPLDVASSGDVYI